MGGRARACNEDEEKQCVDQRITRTQHGHRVDVPHPYHGLHDTAGAHAGMPAHAHARKRMQARR